MDETTEAPSAATEAGAEEAGVAETTAAVPEGSEAAEAVDPEIEGMLPEGMAFDPETGELIPDPNAVPADGQGFGEFLDLLMAGGPTMWLLALLSVIALGIIVAKLIEFYVLRIDRLPSAHQADSGKESLADEMLSRLEERPADISTEHAVDRQVEAVERRLSRYMPGLAFIAGIAPLIGLFGTVLGMIAAFRAMEAAGSRVDPSILSGGIWEALLTTAGGLTVAIPAAIAHHLLSGRIGRSVAAFEELAHRAVGGRAVGALKAARQEEGKRDAGLRAAI